MDADAGATEGRSDAGRAGSRAARLRELMARFSIEVTPRELDKLPPLTDVLAPGTSVFITWLPNASFDDTVACARRIHDAGLVPVPHLAARAVRSEAQIEEIVGALEAEGVTRVLAIAGSVDEVAGPFPATIDLLRTGVLQRHGITWVGVAGHPEGSPDVDPADLVQAIVDKNTFALESGLEMEIVSQFSFAPEPVLIWERALREAGNRLPIRVGLPGAASAPTLLRFGLRCGIGPSVAVMRKRAGSVLKLASAKPQYPEATVIGVADAEAEARFRTFHFFPFGAFTRTAAWARAISDGRFTIASREHLVVTD
jgi:methylenetetrahydrofolate reductase (NADPH)